MGMEFNHPVIGEEVETPDGLGRVVEYRDSFPFQWIQVDTYVRNRGCKWDPCNVKKDGTPYRKIKGKLKVKGKKRKLKAA